MKLLEQSHTKKNTEDYMNMVTFDRKELEPILKIYGQMVAKGVWRDYSISSTFSRAIFAIFRRSTETPLYMIMKTPKLSKKNGLYSIVGMNGQILKQGKELRLVLQVLNKKLFKIL